MSLPGYHQKIQNLIEQEDLDGFELGRVIIEHKERYVVQTDRHQYSSEITGNLRYTAESRADFPAVGDWVKIMPMDEDKAIIMSVLPRFSWLERRAVGKTGEKQMIATNIDVAFIVQALGQDNNLNRLDRYLTICKSGKIHPIVILTKADLVSQDEIEEFKTSIIGRHKNLEILVISSLSKLGYEQFDELLSPNNTYCLIGSSGVGKSTIINTLTEKTQQQTKEVSLSTNKGKHTTTHRELIELPSGAVLIDTPGMRELGMTDADEGLSDVFEKIEVLSDNCRFNDCTHSGETGCAVEEALESGELDYETLESYQKLKREQARFQSTIAEKRKKERDQTKLYRSIQEERRNRKY